MGRTSDGIPPFWVFVCVVIYIGIGGSTRVPQIQQLYTVHLVIQMMLLRLAKYLQWFVCYRLTKRVHVVSRLETK